MFVSVPLRCALQRERELDLARLNGVTVLCSSGRLGSRPETRIVELRAWERGMLEATIGGDWCCARSVFAPLEVNELMEIS